MWYNDIILMMWRYLVTVGRLSKDRAIPNNKIIGSNVICQYILPNYTPYETMVLFRYQNKIEISSRSSWWSSFLVRSLVLEMERRHPSRVGFEQNFAISYSLCHLLLAPELGILSHGWPLIYHWGRLSSILFLFRPL